MYNYCDNCIIGQWVTQCRDGRLKPGDELLMVDGKSLVGLSHSEAVAVLKSTQQLVQLVVATEVSQLLARRSDAFDRGDAFV